MTGDACSACGGPLFCVWALEVKRKVGISVVPATSETLVAYDSPDDHDDNCRKRTYECADGHETTLRLRRRCPAPGCGWTGKEECQTCQGVGTTDEWPRVLWGKLKTGEVKPLDLQET